MKSYCFFIILYLNNFTASSQTQIGIKTGANMGGTITKNNGKKDAAIKNATGHTIQAELYIILKKSWKLQTGMQYENLHSKVNTNSITNGGGFMIHETFSGKSLLNYINIPIKILYTIPAGTGSFQLGAGPFLGIAISGKSESTDIKETTVGTTTTRSQFDYNEKITFGSADTDTKRTNYGFGIDLSYQMKNKICFSVYSNIGLSNINNEANRNVKTTSYGVTIGYSLKRKQ